MYIMLYMKNAFLSMKTNIETVKKKIGRLTMHENIFIV